MNPEHVNPVKKNFDNTSAKIVSDQKIWVKLMELIDEIFKHLSFSVKNGDVLF